MPALIVDTTETATASRHVFAVTALAASTMIIPLIQYIFLFRSAIYWSPPLLAIFSWLLFYDRVKLTTTNYIITLFVSFVLSVFIAVSTGYAIGFLQKTGSSEYLALFSISTLAMIYAFKIFIDVYIFLSLARCHEIGIAGTNQLTLAYKVHQYLHRTPNEVRWLHKPRHPLRAALYFIVMLFVGYVFFQCSTETRLVWRQLLFWVHSPSVIIRILRLNSCN
jgi:hypothetical protein